MKLRIHPVFWLVLAAGIVTGHFWEVATVFFIVIVHEAGHAVAAKAFGWRLASIDLLPFGGVARVDENGHRPLREELIVTLMGPLQHLWLPTISFALTATPFWNAENHHLFLERNWMILFFNLLPIWPLDGGRLLHLWLTKQQPYLSAYRVTLIYSVLALGVLSTWLFIAMPFSLNFFAIAAFLAMSIYIEWKQSHYKFLRFLLDRWQRKDVKKKKHRTLIVPAHLPLLDVFEKFYQDDYHCIRLQNDPLRRQVNEDELLDAFFSGQFHGRVIGDYFH